MSESQFTSPRSLFKLSEQTESLSKFSRLKFGVCCVALGILDCIFVDKLIVRVMMLNVVIYFYLEYQLPTVLSYDISTLILAVYRCNDRGSAALANFVNPSYPYRDANAGLCMYLPSRSPTSNMPGVSHLFLSKYLCVCVCTCVRACVRACGEGWTAGSCCKGDVVYILIYLKKQKQEKA